jgi:hypothetical protein
MGEICMGKLNRGPWSVNNMEICVRELKIQIFNYS